VDFDFLPKLPKSDLDDRTFDDLVEECLLRIPRYCPEWTNYNPSDPGITTIELFAWLTDQMLMRFNQVPRRNYVAFLELLGIRLKPAKPSQTNLTFYLSAAREEKAIIEAGTEVATKRLETEDVVRFSTDHRWTIGTPKIAHILTARTKKTEGTTFEDFRENGWEPNRSIREPQNETSDDRQPASEWSGPLTNVFQEPPKGGNCFYIVLESQPLESQVNSQTDGEVLENLNSNLLATQDKTQDHAIAGNVITISFQGNEAGATGIDPNNPPRCWEVWNGIEWQSKDVLQSNRNDRTKGFSFEEATVNARNGTKEADVILHLPIQLPEEDFSTNYRGYWLRCRCENKDNSAANYDRSPKISGVSVRSIGATVPATHCTWIKEEFLGVSNGQPGQKFELLNKPILARNDREYIEIRSPKFGDSPEKWIEVENFADSDKNSPHYMIDDSLGMIQFGPLIREPKGIKNETSKRRENQQNSQSKLEYWNRNRLDLPVSRFERSSNYDEESVYGKQYGKIPPKGSEIYMMAYRTGGGETGNVQARKLTQLMASIPYIRSVINYESARDGKDAESLEQAVMHVPKMLRTNDRAVTRKDFETLVWQFDETYNLNVIARTRCLDVSSHNRGQVTVLVIPKVEDLDDFTEGIKPARFKIDRFQKDLQEYLQERCLLGTRVEIKTPNYVRICACLELAIDVKLIRDGRQSLDSIESAVKQALYRLLNPVGDRTCPGWKFEQPILATDLANVCQKISGISYIQNVQLFRVELERENYDYPDWKACPIVDLEQDEMICSWAQKQNNDSRAGHSQANGSPASIKIYI
jgi:predicted phage baseplate assembly protein